MNLFKIAVSAVEGFFMGGPVGAGVMGGKELLNEEAQQSGNSDVIALAGAADKAAMFIQPESVAASEINTGLG